MAAEYREAGHIMGRYEELKQVYAGRNQKMRDWESAYKMQVPRSEPGYTPIPSNRVRTTVDMITAILSGQDTLRIHIPVFSTSTAEEKLASKKEWWLRGVLKQFNRVLGRRLWQPNLQWILAQHIALRGWYAVRVILEEEADNPFQITVYDPRACVQAWGDGLVEFGNRQRLKWSSAWAEIEPHAKAAGIKFSDKAEMTQVELTDWWVRENGSVYNIILLDGEPIKDALTSFDEIPIITGPSAGLGLRDTLGDVDPQYNPSDPFTRGYYDQSFETTIGLSVADGVMQQQRAESIMASLLMANFEKWVNPPKKIWTPDGRERDVDFSPDALNFMRNGAAGSRDDMEEMRHQGQPPETEPLWQFLNSSMQRGSIADSMFGQASQELSGFAVNQLLTAAMAVAAPRGDTLKYVFEEICRSLLKQYAKFSSPLPVYAYDRHLGAFRTGDLQPSEALGAPPLMNETGEYGEASPSGLYGAEESDEELAPTDLYAAHRCDVEVFLKLNLPNDLMQRATVSQIMRTGEYGPAMSDNYLRENVMEIGDAALEVEHLRQEAAERDPEIQLINWVTMYKEAAAKGDPGADEKVVTYEKRLQILRAKADLELSQTMQAAAPPPPQGGPMEGPPGMPPGGMPPPDQGPPPEEGGGILPPDLMADLQGELPGGPPSPGGPFDGNVMSGPAPGMPGVNGIVSPPVMQGTVPMGQVPIADQGVPLDQQQAIDQLKGMGIV